MSDLCAPADVGAPATNCIVATYTGRWSLASSDQDQRSVTSESDSPRGGTWLYSTNAFGFPRERCDVGEVVAEHSSGNKALVLFYANNRTNECLRVGYHDGRLNGPWRSRTPAGQLLGCGETSNGRPIGEWRWFDADGACRERIDWTSDGKKFANGGQPGTTEREDEDARWREYLQELMYHSGDPPGVLISPYVVTNGSVIGWWGDYQTSGLSWDVMVVAPGTGSLMTVSVSSFSDVGGRHEMTTDALYDAGVLTMRVPISMVEWSVFRRAYVVSFQGRRLLVPEGLLRSVERGRGLGKCMEVLNLENRPGVTRLRNILWEGIK